jgi:AbrB family looped-hinge helix DNA binding protein
MMMSNIVEVDARGRITLPRKLRGKLSIGEKTQLLLIKTKDGGLLLIKFEIDQIARRLAEELKGVDVEGIAKSIGEDLNKEISKEHPEFRKVATKYSKSSLESNSSSR